MYAMNIQNDVIGLVLRENCKSKQVTDFIAWPSRCHGRISEILKVYIINSITKSYILNIKIRPLVTEYALTIKLVILYIIKQLFNGNAGNRSNNVPLGIGKDQSVLLPSVVEHIHEYNLIMVVVVMLVHLFFVLFYCVFLRSEFRVVMSATISA
jgi:hypothetical protein